MKVLLTGSTGFIGSHTKDLLTKSHQVFSFQGDITKTGDWAKNLQKFPETIIHIAGIRTETKQDLKINLGGVKALSQALNKSSKLPKSIIFISSQAVYFGQNSPLKENMQLNPPTFYGKSKFQAEQIISDLGEKLGIRTVSLRLSTVLGPGVRKGNKMSGPLYYWVENAKNNQPIEVFQDGNQTRDYINVSDVARAISLALDNDQIKGIFNIGGGKKIKLIELAKLIKKTFKSQSEIIIKGGEASINDPRDLFSDTAKFEKFGWKAKPLMFKA